jgi:L-asparaginase type II
MLATGGTIANTPSGRVHLQEVAAVVPQVHDVARIEIEELMRVGSAQVGPKEWLIIGKRINDVMRENVDGIVVTQGSNTLEETAYFLHLVVKGEKPVVITAAQRQFTTLSSDSPKNFLDAVRVAACPEARGKGVLAVVNEEINCARDVIKRMSYRVQTYNAPDLGILGLADTEQISFYRAPIRRHTISSEFDIGNLEALPRVEIIYSCAGADGMLIDAAIAAGAKGLVLAVLPTGAPAPGMKESLLKAASSGVPVVYANRGGGQDRLRMMMPDQPFVAGDNLNPQKARILLMLALTRTQDNKEIQWMFNEY